MVTPGTPKSAATRAALGGIAATLMIGLAACGNTVAGALSLTVALIAGARPATPALITGILTWLALTARHDLAPPR